MPRCIALSLLISSIVFARSSKISPDLANGGTAKTDIIVQFIGPPTAADHAQILARGGARKLDLPGINGAAFSVPAAALEGIANNPHVKYVSRDRYVAGMLDVSTAAVHASTVWPYGLVGSGIGVAVVDSGITPVTDLLNTAKTSRIVYSEAFGGLTDTLDAFGHGTHVAGIIAANGISSSGKFTGMAPNSNIINLRVLDGNGSGQDSAVIAAIQRAIDLKAKYNIRILNLSLGRPVFESYTLDPLCQVVEQAWKAGIFVVVAAGNNGRDDSQATDGYATIQSPANDPYVITVGAMKTMGTPDRTDDLVASYSSKGPTLIDHIVKPDIVAPGNVVASTLTNNTTLYGSYPSNEIFKSYYTGNTNSNSLSNIYYRLSGTSMAAPMVSGAAALLVQAFPMLTPDQIKARLMKTATKTFPTSSVATDPITGITTLRDY